MFYILFKFIRGGLNICHAAIPSKVDSSLSNQLGIFMYFHLHRLGERIGYIHVRCASKDAAECVLLVSLLNNSAKC